MSNLSLYTSLDKAMLYYTAHARTMTKESFTPMPPSSRGNSCLKTSTIRMIWIEFVILPKQFDGFVGKLIHEHDFQRFLLGGCEAACDGKEQGKSCTFEMNHYFPESNNYYLGRCCFSRGMCLVARRFIFGCWRQFIESFAFRAIIHTSRLFVVEPAINLQLQSTRPAELLCTHSTITRSHKKRTSASSLSTNGLRCRMTSKTTE